jgi:hypothetical protein
MGHPGILPLFLNLPEIVFHAVGSPCFCLVLRLPPPLPGIAAAFAAIRQEINYAIGRQFLTLPAVYFGAQKYRIGMDAYFWRKPTLVAQQ